MTIHVYNQRPGNFLRSTAAFAFVRLLVTPVVSVVSFYCSIVTVHQHSSVNVRLVMDTGSCP